MLNPFPIQFLALFAYFLLRICVAGVLTYLGISHLDHKRAIAESVTHVPQGFRGYFAIGLGTFELGLALFFVAGFLTQIAALFTMVLAVKMIIFHSWIPSKYIPSRIVYVLLFGASLSLFITGAGAFAFDLPI